MRAGHGTTHQDHAGTSRAAPDIEHRTSQRMGMRADGRPPVRLDIDIDIDTGNAVEMTGRTAGYPPSGSYR
jgi:hypothetical protein